MQRPKLSTNDTQNKRSSPIHVGVIVPCCNNADTILDTLKCLTTQNVSVLLTIVNDGSTDATEQVLRNSLTDVKTDTLDDKETFTVGKIYDIPTILISHESTEGMPKSKNKGVLALWQKMKYLTVLLPTSIFLPNKLATCVAVAETDERIGIVYHDRIVHDYDAVYREFLPPYKREFLERNPFVADGALISKSALEACGGFEHTLEMYDDWDLWLRITERFIAIHIAKVLGEYELTEKTIHNEAAMKVLERMKARKL